MNTATATTTKTDNHTKNDNDAIDVEVIDHKNAAAENDANDAAAADRAHRAPFTAAFLRQFDAARNKLTTHLEAGQKNIDELQKKALDLVSHVQSRAEKVGDKVREEGKEATTRLDELRKGLGSKFPLKIDLESWLNLPFEARQEVLSVLGIASDKQTRELHNSVELLREELIVLIEAQTAVLKEIIQGSLAASTAGLNTAALKTAPRKSATARKPSASTARARKKVRKTAPKKTVVAKA